MSTTAKIKLVGCAGVSFAALTILAAVLNAQPWLLFTFAGCAFVSLIVLDRIK